MKYSKKRHDELMEKLIDEYSGTPEELGALLAEATMSPPQRGWYRDEYVKAENRRITNARMQIRELPSGAELLELEYLERFV